VSIVHTWREEILNEMGRNGESWDKLVGVNCSDEAWLDRDSDGPRKNFVVWTEDYVYFPSLRYDRARGYIYDVGSVWRNPPEKQTP
jgi:hypothetical protein